MKKPSKTAAFLLCAALLALTHLTGCAGQTAQPQPANSSAAPAKPAETTVEMKIAHLYPEEHFISVLLRDFWGPEIEKRTNGSVKIALYANSTLATQEQSIEAMKANTIQGNITGSILQSEAPLAAVYQLPFLFKDAAHARRVLTGEIGETVNAAFEKAQFHVVAPLSDGFRVITSKRPVTSLQDLKGLKLRVPSMENMIAMAEALGCAATPMAMSEVFTALQQGVIDGQENPYSTVRTAGYFEVCDYIIETNHVFSYGSLCINTTVWNALSDNQKKIIEEVSRELREKQWDQSLAQDEADKAAIFKARPACQLLVPSNEFRAEMVKMTQPLYEKMYKTSPEIQAVVERIQAAENG